MEAGAPCTASGNMCSVWGELSVPLTQPLMPFGCAHAQDVELASLGDKIKQLQVRCGAVRCSKEPAHSSSWKRRPHASCFSAV